MNPANLILPISARLGSTNLSQPSVFAVPGVNASNTISFPRNANRAIFSLSSTGQANEEFWWSNGLQSDILAFNASGGVLAGFSPFREVQVFIDGMLAGVQWPFSIIFTGGVVPAFWSPMVGIDAFDLKEYEIDISPFLPLLCDGNTHTFTMKVSGLNDTVSGVNDTATLSEITGSNWQLTGKIFIWLDSDPNSITTGPLPSISASAPTIAVTQQLTQNSTGTNETLTYTTSIQRSLSISSTIKTQNGTQSVSWSQSLSHTDKGIFLNFGNIQSNEITTEGSDVSSGAVPFSNTYTFPFFANTTATLSPNGSTTFTALLTRSKNITTTGTSLYPSPLQVFAASSDPKISTLAKGLEGYSVTTTQNGTAVLILVPGNSNASGSFGSTSQVFRVGGVSAQGTLGMQDTELFFRRVGAVNGTVNGDVERMVGKEVVAVVDEGGGVSGGVGMDLDFVAGRRRQVVLGQNLGSRGGD
jgi:hypothetical protein